MENVSENSPTATSETEITQMNLFTSHQTTVKIRYFAGIAQSAGISEETIEIPTRGALTSSLINILARRHGEDFVHKLGICALLMGGKRLDYTDHLPDVDAIEIDVLPPFAGG